MWLFNSLKPPEIRTILLPILEVKTLRLKDVPSLASVTQRWDADPDGPSLLHSAPRCLPREGIRVSGTGTL